MKSKITLVLVVMLSQVYGQLVPKKVIIDCDPGIDDAMALLYALQSPEIEVIGITTTFGNTPTHLSTENVLRITELIGKNIPVYEGAHYPLLLPKHQPASHVHGKDGLGNLNLPKPKGSKEEKDAINYLIEACKENPKEVTIITLGALTNLALATKLDSTFASNVKEVIVMGGAALTTGNISPVAEANIYGDPHAADIVLSAPWKVNMIGLDVTSKIIVNSDMFACLKAKKPKQAEFLIGISEFYSRFYKSFGIENGFLFHDPTTLIYFTNKEFFETIKGPVRVVYDGIAKGKTIVNLKHQRLADPRDNMPFVEIAVDVQSDKIIKKYFEVLKN